MIVQNTHKKWKSIPDDLLEMNNLKELDLSFNEIEALDDRIGNWTTITHLDLSHNQIDTFPEQIRYLSSLRFLNLGHNPIRIIPDWIHELKQLETLFLANSNLMDISDIRELPSLKMLDISYNPIRTLSMSLASCKQLSSLKMIGNRLDTFPIVLTYLSSIKNYKDLDMNHRLRISDSYLNQFFMLIRRLNNNKVSHEIREAAITFFIDDGDVHREYLFMFLNIAPSVLWKQVRAYLISSSEVSAISEKNIAVLGTCDWLDESQHNVFNLREDTQYVYLGRNIPKSDIQLLRSHHHFIHDRTLFDCLNPNVPHQSNELPTNKIFDLLMSGADANIALAIQIVDDALYWADYLEVLFIAYTFINTSNVSLRQQLKQIITLCDARFPIDALPKPAFTFKTKRSEEELTRILVDISKDFHCLDTIEVAKLLFLHFNIGYDYILKHIGSHKLKQWLVQFCEENTLRLSSCKKIKDLPKFDKPWEGITTLDLKGCTFRKLPTIESLRQFPNLRIIDLRDNPIRFLPQSIDELYAVYQIFLTRKK